MKSNFNHNKKQFVFKRWTNKSYAVFSSFGKVIKIGALSLSCLIVAAPAQSQEKKDSSSVQKVIDFDEVEVTGESAPLIYSMQTRIVTIINREEIESSPAQNIQELLEYALNIDLRTRGGNDVQADISLRGGSFDQTLILLNGISVSDPQTGHYSLNLPVDFESIQRIEILHGPAARMYGPNAFNGAINIITSCSHKNSANIYSSYGQHNLVNSGGSVQLTKTKLTTFVAANYKRSDAYIRNTDLKGANLFYQGMLKLNKAKFSWQAGYNKKEFGALAFYSDKYPDQFEQNETRFGSLSTDFGRRIKVSGSVYYRQHNDHFVLFRAHPEWYQNFHISQSYGAKTKFAVKWNFGVSSAGAGLRTDQIRSNNLGSAISDSSAVKDYSGYYYNKGAGRKSLNLFVDHSIYFRALTVSAGMMIQSFEFNKPECFPGIDLSLKLNEQYTLIASLNKSMRMPTFTDLYYSGPANKGNDQLLPEKSLTCELGMKMDHSGWNGLVTVFSRSGSNMIDWVWLEKEELWHTQNITGIYTFGVESSVSLELESLTGLKSFVRQLRLDYAYLQQEKTTGDIETKYVLDNLKHNVSITLRHTIYRGVSASWKLAYRDRNGTYQSYNSVTESYSTRTYDSYFTGDMRIGWKGSNLKVYVDVSNFLNVEYIDIGSVPQPGRWIKAGASYRFDFN